MKLKLTRGIALIFMANLVNLVFNMLTVLLLPKFLSVETYADIKTFQLCLLYVGILHLGYNDGMYLKYGGKSFSDIRGTDIQSNVVTVQIFQFIVMLAGVLLGIILRQPMVTSVAVVVLPYNLIAYYKFLFQACGEFHIYSRVLNSVTMGLFAVNMFFLFLVRTDNGYCYIYGYILLYFIIWTALEIMVRRKLRLSLKMSQFSFTELGAGISQGILLMAGNFSSTFITSMDRWFVKIFMYPLDFAQYSFAVSVENFLNVAISPLTVTLYNYFCGNCSYETVGKIRKRMVLMGCAIVAAAFPVKFLLHIYLEKYVEAEKVVFLLFASQIFYVVNKCVFSNLYKARKQQIRYFVGMMKTFIVAFVLNIAGYCIFRVKEGFAVGTLLSSVFWFVIVNRDFKECHAMGKEVLFMMLSTVSFLLCGFYCGAALGLLIYIMIYVFLAVLLMKDTFISSISDMKEMVISRKVRMK